MKIIRLNLLKGVSYFDPPANIDKVKQSISANEAGILKWYLKTPKKFKDIVFEKPSKKYNISRIGFFINEDKNVLITSSNLNLNVNKFRSPCVVLKDHITKTEEMKEVKGQVRVGDSCILYWQDAIANFALGSIKEITEISHVSDVAKVGFLLHKDDKEIYIAPHYNKNYDKYREVLVVPTSNIIKLKKLVPRT